MVRKRKAYLEENKETKANGYYLRRTPKTILGEMELRESNNIPPLYLWYNKKNLKR